MFRGRYRNLIFILKVGGRNFERPNLERPIFRNLKMPMLKVTRGPIIRLF